MGAFFSSPLVKTSSSRNLYFFLMSLLSLRFNFCKNLIVKNNNLYLCLYIFLAKENISYMFTCLENLVVSIKKEIVLNSWNTFLSGTPKECSFNNVLCYVKNRFCFINVGIFHFQIKC